MTVNVKPLPANRVAALATCIAGLVGCVTALASAWPSPTMNEIALIAGSVGTFAGPIAHIVGSWLWDRTPAGQVLGAGLVPAPASAPAPPSQDPDPGATPPAPAA